GDYEETVKDAAKKREDRESLRVFEDDLALVAQKVQEKADLETDLNDDKSDMKGKKKDRTGPR
ncbi:unnamed protein product, partial [Durusdinium trenchii]